MIHPSKGTFEPTLISSMQLYILSAIHLDFYQLEMLISLNVADVGEVFMHHSPLLYIHLKLLQLPNIIMAASKRIKC